MTNLGKATVEIEPVMTTRDGNAQAIINTAIEAAGPQPLDDEGRFFSVVTPVGAKHHVVDLQTHLEQFRETPRRKTGTYVVHDVPSFAGYFEKHRTADSEVWGDVVGSKLVAVLNANGADIDTGAMWEDHRLSYAVKQSVGWQAWTAIDGRYLSQVAFAEHIEARAIDIVQPSSAAMLDIAQTFEANTSVEFQSGEVLQSGERKLTYKETTTAKAGQTGSVEIPKEIHLALVPFEGADAFRVVGRFRYRISRDGQLSLAVFLERPEDILREAFLDVVDKVETQIGHVVLRGSGR